MSYLGKVYKHEKDENLDEFAKVLQLSDEKAEGLTKFKPSLKLDLDGDTYTLSIIHEESGVTVKDIKFQSGVEFEDKISDSITAKTVITVNGDVVIQKQTHDEEHVITYKKEYDGDKLLETITTSFWDGSAKRFFSAE